VTGSPDDEELEVDEAIVSEEVGSSSSSQTGDNFKTIKIDVDEKGGSKGN